MNARIPQLRIKLKNLADEARTIRVEEERALDRRAPVPEGQEPTRAQLRPRRRDDVLYADLRDHRRGIVRTVARRTLLAYGMLRGMPYRQIEQNASSEPEWTEIRKAAERFGAVRDPRVEQYTAEGNEAWAARLRAQGAAFDAWLAAAKASFSAVEEAA